MATIGHGSNPVYHWHIYKNEVLKKNRSGQVREPNFYALLLKKNKKNKHFFIFLRLFYILNIKKNKFVKLFPITPWFSYLKT